MSDIRSVVEPDSAKSVLKIVRRVLRLALTVKHSVPEFAPVAPSTLLQLTEVTLSALEEVKAWAGAVRSKAAKAEFAEVFEAVGKLLATAAHSCALASEPGILIVDVFGVVSGNAAASPLVLSHFAIAAGAFGGDCTSIIPLCVSKLLAGLKQLPKYSKVRDCVLRLCSALAVAVVNVRVNCVVPLYQKSRLGMLEALSRLLYSSTIGTPLLSQDDAEKCFATTMLLTDLGVDGVVGSATGFSATEFSGVAKRPMDDDAIGLLCFILLASASPASALPKLSSAVIDGGVVSVLA